MKIYLDYIFIENVIINIVIFYELKNCIKKQPKVINFIIATLLLSTYTTITTIFLDTILKLIIIKIIIVIISVYILFVPKNIIELLKESIFYYLISFLYIGIIISITLFFNINIEKIYIKILIYILSLVILVIFNKELWKVWKKDIKTNDLTYIINIKGQELIGFVDTGNSVKDIFTNLDVIFLSQKSKESLKSIISENKKVKIKITTISSKEDEIEGYIIENIEISKNKKIITKIKKIIICFANINLQNKGYQAILSYDFYMEKLRGA